MKYKCIGLLLFLFVMANAQGYQKTQTEEAFSKLLSGDFQEAEKSISEAIHSDEKAYDALYFRAYLRLYKNDTTGSISDFKQALLLKQKCNHLSGDTLLKRLLLEKPNGPKGLCSDKYNSLDANLFLIVLGFWYLLVNENKKEACMIFGELDKQGIQAIRTVGEQFCK